MKQIGDQPVAVFAVWQPMLPTDWSAPTASVLGRLPSRRVRQYWDPDHLVAKRMGTDARAPQPIPDCCKQAGILWDLAAVYAPDAIWTDRMPPAMLMNGPVVSIADSLLASIRMLAPVQ